MKDDTRKSFDEYRDEELFDLIAREAYTKNSDLIFQVTEVATFIGTLVPEGLESKLTRRCQVDPYKAANVKLDSRFKGFWYQGCFMLCSHPLKLLHELSPTERVECPYEGAIADLFSKIAEKFEQQSPKKK